MDIWKKLIADLCHELDNSVYLPTKPELIKESLLGFRKEKFKNYIEQKVIALVTTLQVQDMQQYLKESLEVKCSNIDCDNLAFFLVLDGDGCSIHYCCHDHFPSPDEEFFWTVDTVKRIRGDHLPEKKE